MRFWPQEWDKRERARGRRRFWVRPGRTQLWWRNFLYDVVVDEEWKENFRMTKRTFMELCDELGPLCIKGDSVEWSYRFSSTSSHYVMLFSR